MAHYAKVTDGKVVQVIVAEPEFFKTFVDDSPGEWIQTSYNTKRGKHYDLSHFTEPITEDNNPYTVEDGGTPLRGNFAGIGMLYDKEGDYFYDDKPLDIDGNKSTSWVFNKTKYEYEPPTAYPSDGKNYHWRESDKSWVEIT